LGKHVLQNNIFVYARNVGGGRIENYGTVFRISEIFMVELWKINCSTMEYARAPATISLVAAFWRSARSEGTIKTLSGTAMFYLVI